MYEKKISQVFSNNFSLVIYFAAETNEFTFFACKLISLKTRFPSFERKKKKNSDENGEKRKLSLSN